MDNLENGVIVTVTTIVGGMVRSETQHTEPCYDGFPEVNYKRDAMIEALEDMGTAMAEAAMSGAKPPWK